MKYFFYVKYFFMQKIFFITKNNLHLKLFAARDFGCWLQKSRFRSKNHDPMTLWPYMGMSLWPYPPLPPSPGGSGPLFENHLLKVATPGFPPLRGGGGWGGIGGCNMSNLVTSKSDHLCTKSCTFLPRAEQGENMGWLISILSFIILHKNVVFLWSKIVDSYFLRVFWHFEGTPPFDVSSWHF